MPVRFSPLHPSATACSHRLSPCLPPLGRPKPVAALESQSLAKNLIYPLCAAREKRGKVAERGREEETSGARPGDRTGLPVHPAPVSVRFLPNYYPAPRRLSAGSCGFGSRANAFVKRVY